MPTPFLNSPAECSAISLLDADAHASRKAAAANLHAAQRDGAYTGGKPDSYETIRAFAAGEAGMEYRPPFLQMRSAENRKAERSPITERGCWGDIVAAAPNRPESAAPKAAH